jgi:hypothetical protein
VISGLLSQLLAWIFISLATVCFLVVLTTLLKSQKAAIAIQFLLMAAQTVFDDGISGLVYSALCLFALMRFGLIAAIFVTFTAVSISNAPITLRNSIWYAPYGYLVLAIFAVIVFYAFRTSIGSRPILGPSRLDE